MGPSTSPRPTSPWRTPATSSSPTAALRPTIWRRAQRWSGSAGWRPWNWLRRRLWRCWQNRVGSREHHVWGASCLRLLGHTLFYPSLSVSYHPSGWLRLVIIVWHFSRSGGFHLSAVLPCAVSGDVSVVVAEGCCSCRHPVTRGRGGCPGQPSQRRVNWAQTSVVSSLRSSVVEVQWVSFWLLMPFGYLKIWGKDYFIARSISRSLQLTVRFCCYFFSFSPDIFLPKYLLSWNKQSL